MAKEKKKALGRGLEALLGSSSATSEAAQKTSGPKSSKRKAAPGISQCPIEQIHPRADQPRRQFEPQRLAELAQSIQEQGILQPLLVRQTGDDSYEIIVGERRWRASQIAGLTTVPVMVRRSDDKQSYTAALIENIQREDLNPMEVAEAYQRIMRDTECTQEQLADAVGKDRSHIANHLRLLQLAPELQRYIDEGLLSFGHGRALAGIKDEDLQRNAAVDVVDKGMSVRQTEALVDRLKKAKTPKSPKAPVDESAERSRKHLEIKLRNHFGGKAKLAYNHAAKKGSITLPFGNLDELDRLTALLGIDNE